MAERLITIFLSTPSDVGEERKALSSLVAEINDVVAFLAPERNVKLKVIYYDDDAYPSVGNTPQEEIDDQNLDDSDIYFGIMWKRCGTPTGSAVSGTVSEFDRALARRQRTGRPTIMFYFSEEPMGVPSSVDEIKQLTNVLEFRRRIEAIGLTRTYPSRAEFRERARTGLLRAVADLLREVLPVRAASVDAAAPVPPALDALAAKYEKIRAEMQPGSARTEKMARVLEDMKAQAPAAFKSLAALANDKSPGRRLAAVATLQVLPAREYVSWLADRLNPELETPFVGYQSTIALLQAVRSLPASDCDVLRTEVTRARALALRNTNDPPRLTALDYALGELKVKCP